MDYSKYEEQLRHEATETWIMWLLVFVLIGALIFMNKSDLCSDMKKWVKWYSNVFIIVVIIIVIINSILLIFNTKSDIENRSYIVYEGEFSIDDYRGNYVYIYEDGKRKTLTYEDANSFAGGTYEGRLVYAQKRERVLEIIDYAYVSHTKLE